MDCGPSGSSVYGIFQARILEWVAISSSRGSSQPTGWTWPSILSPASASEFFTIGPPEKQLTSYFCSQSCPRIHHSPSPIPARFVLSCLNHSANSLRLLTWWPPITLFLWSTFSVTLRDFSYWSCEPYLQWPYNAISYICDLHWSQDLLLFMTIWFSSLWTLSPYSSVPKVFLTDLNSLTLWSWPHLDGTLVSTTIIENHIHMFPSTLIPSLFPTLFPAYPSHLLGNSWHCLWITFSNHSP